MGHMLIGVLHGELDLGDQIGILAQIADGRAGGLAVLALPCVERLGIDRDQGADERLVVADGHRLADQGGMGAQGVLEHCGGATFLPPAVTMISFLRPVIDTNPSASTLARSPVWNQPSTIASLVAFSLRQ